MCFSGPLCGPPGMVAPGTPRRAFPESLAGISGLPQGSFGRASGRLSGRPEIRPALSAGGDQSGRNSSPDLFGEENLLPAESIVFNAAGGEPWPLLPRNTFARRRADPNPDLSQTLAGDRAGANGASNGGIRAEIRPSLGFLGFLSFSLRLLSMRSGG